MVSGGSGEGSLSPHPDLFSLFLDSYIPSSRFVNGCFENKSRKCLFLGNHLDSWKSYSFVKIILQINISEVKLSS